MFPAVLGFPEGRVIVPFLRRRPQVFPRVKVIMNLKRLVVLLDNKLSIITLHLFCFLLAFCLRGKMSNMTSSSLRSFHIYRKWNGRRNVRFSMKRKGQYAAHVFSCEFCKIFKKTYFSEHVRTTVPEYSRIEFFVNIAQLSILSYPAIPWKMFPFKNTHALFSFSSTIVGNTDTVQIIEGFIY